MTLFQSLQFSSAMEKIKSSDIKENEKLQLEILFKNAIDILIKTQNWNSNNVRVSAVDGLKMFMLNGDANVNKVIYKTLDVLRNYERKFLYDGKS